MSDEIKASEMTLRDFLAAVALHGMLAADTELDTFNLTSASYEVADYMLAARDEQ